LYFLTSGHSDALPWASECADVKNYKWQINAVWHRMLYGCTHEAAVNVKRVKLLFGSLNIETKTIIPYNEVV